MTGKRETSAAKRHAAALALSLACHAGLLLAISGGGLVLDETVAPIVVTLIASAGERSAGEGSHASAGGPAEAARRPAVADEAVRELPEAALREAGEAALREAEKVALRVARGAPPKDKLARRARRRAQQVVAPGSEPGAPARASTGAAPEPPSEEARVGDDVGSAGIAGPARGSGAATALRGGSAGGGDGSDGRADAGGGGGGEDLRASCRQCPTPDYPARARRQGWQGTVDVDLRVSRDGVVEEARVGRSSGFALLDAAAVSVAERSRFWVSRGAAGLRGQLRYRFVLEDPGVHRPL